MFGQLTFQDNHQHQFSGHTSVVMMSHILATGGVSAGIHVALTSKYLVQEDLDVVLTEALRRDNHLM